MGDNLLDPVDILLSLFGAGLVGSGGTSLCGLLLGLGRSSIYGTSGEVAELGTFCIGM